MSSERHYDEKEIAAIFERATKAQEASKLANPHEKGLSLAELQAIGAASGISADFIAQAAATINHTTKEAPPVRTLGITTGVGRTVDLPGKLSDEAWERLVVDIRDTFQAAGKLQRQGGLRQWSNGNLQVLVEPTESGDRLRMKTHNQNMQGMMLGGAIGSVMMLFLMAAVVVKGDVEGALVMMAPLFLTLGMFGYGVFQLPSWSRTRAAQMEALGARAVELAATPSTTAETTPAAPSQLTPPTEEPTSTLDLDASLDEPAQPTRTTRRVR